MTAQTPQQLVRGIGGGNQGSGIFLTYLTDRNPTPQDIGSWQIGQRWINTALSPVQEFILQSLPAANGFLTANWVLLGRTTLDVNTLTGNTGGAVGPDSSGNINVVGDGTSITLAGNPSTHTLTASLVNGSADVQTLSDDVGTVITPNAGNIQLQGHVVEQGSTKFSTVVAGSSIAKINPMSSARWIVDPLGFNGTHTTITDALASATSGDTIFVMPGTYTEDLTLVPGIDLASYTSDAFSGNVTIIGNTTLSVAGSVSISGINLQTGSSFAISVTGSAASILNLINCYIFVTSGTAIDFSSSSASAEINLYYCVGDTMTTGVTYFSHSGAGALFFIHCDMFNSGHSATVSTISGSGSVAIWLTDWAIPFTSSSTSDMDLQLSRFGFTADGTITCNSTRSPDGANMYMCTAGPSTTPVVTIGTGATMTISHSELVSTNTNCISGDGTLIAGIISYALSSKNSIATILPQPISLGAINAYSGSGAPINTAPQGSIYFNTAGSGINDRAYINTDGSTGWTAIVTAS